MSKIVTKEEIKNIVNETVENITSKSYSHKPHLASLPYDRKGRTSDELFERYSACLDGMKKTREKLDDLRKQSFSNTDKWHDLRHTKEGLVEEYNNMRDDNQRFFDAEAKVLDERKRVLNSIRDTMNLDVVIPEKLRSKIEGLEKYFNTGWISNEEIFTDLANEVIDWRYSIERDDTQWGNTVDGIADDIRVLGSNDFFDKDLPKLYKNTHDESEFGKLIDNIDKTSKEMNETLNEGKEIDKELHKQERIFTDYHVESEKTKLSYVKTGVLDDEVKPGKKETWIKNQKKKIQQMEDELY